MYKYRNIKLTTFDLKTTLLWKNVLSEYNLRKRGLQIVDKM
jgi:hypothetical protein